MTALRIVTHCLAVWNLHTGVLSQQDKDFFDEHITHVQETDELVAALELVKIRLERDGLSSERAYECAHQLLLSYAEKTHQRFPALVVVE